MLIDDAADGGQPQAEALVSLGREEGLEYPRDDLRGDPSAALRRTRKAYFRELGGMVETPVYLGDALQAGNRIEAPAIIEEATTTVVVFPGSEVGVTELGSYHVRIG